LRWVQGIGRKATISSAGSTEKNNRSYSVRHMKRNEQTESGKKQTPDSGEGRPHLTREGGGDHEREKSQNRGKSSHVSRMGPQEKVDMEKWKPQPEPPKITEFRPHP